MLLRSLLGSEISGVSSFTEFTKCNLGIEWDLNLNLGTFLHQPRKKASIGGIIQKCNHEDKAGFPCVS